MSNPNYFTFNIGPHTTNSLGDFPNGSPVNTGNVINLSNPTGALWGTPEAPLSHEEYTISSDNMSDFGQAFVITDNLSVPTFSGDFLAGTGYPDSHVSGKINVWCVINFGGRPLLSFFDAFAAPSGGGGGGGSYDFAGMTNLRAWFDHTDMDGSGNDTLTDGAVFTTLTDQLGNETLSEGNGVAYEAATQSMNFNGSTHYFRKLTGFGISATPFAITCVALARSGASNADSLWGNNDSSGGGCWLGQYSGGYRLFAGSNAATNSAYTVDQFQIVTAIVNGTSSELYINSNTATWEADGSSENPGTNTINGQFCLGSITSSNFRFDGKMKDVFIFDGLPQDLTNFHNALATRHSITLS